MHFLSVSSPLSFICTLLDLNSNSLSWPYLNIGAMRETASIVVRMSGILDFQARQRIRSPKFSNCRGLYQYIPTSISAKLYIVMLAGLWEHLTPLSNSLPHQSNNVCNPLQLTVFMVNEYVCISRGRCGGYSSQRFKVAYSCLSYLYTSIHKPL